jgi:hypothetical protein
MMDGLSLKHEKAGLDEGLGEAVMRLSSMKVSLLAAVIGREGIEKVISVVSRSIEEPASGERLFGKYQEYSARVATLATLKSFGRGGRASFMDVADFILSTGGNPEAFVSLFDGVKNDKEIRRTLESISETSVSVANSILTSCLPHLRSKARRVAYSKGRSRGVDAEALAEDLASEGAMHALEKLIDRIYVSPGISPQQAASQACSYLIKTAAGRMVDAAWDLSMEITLPRSVIRTMGKRNTSDESDSDANRQDPDRPWRGMLKSKLSLAPPVGQDDSSSGRWHWDPPASDPVESANGDFEIWKENLLEVAALTVATMTNIDAVNVLIKYLKAFTPLFESVCYISGPSMKSRKDLAALAGVSESRITQILLDMSPKARRTLDRWKLLCPEEAVVKVAGLALEQTIESKAKFKFIPAAIIRKLRGLADMMKDDHEAAYLKLIGSSGTSNSDEDGLKEIGGNASPTETRKNPRKKSIDIIKGISTQKNKENDMCPEETPNVICESDSPTINEENNVMTEDNQSIYQSQTQSINKENGMNIKTKSSHSSTSASSREPSQSPFAGYCDNMTKSEVATLLLEGVTKARSFGVTTQAQLTTLCLQAIVASVDLGILETFLETALGSAKTTKTEAVNEASGNGKLVLSEPNREVEKDVNPTLKRELSSLQHNGILEEDNERGIKIIRSVLSANPGIAMRAGTTFYRKQTGKKWTKYEALLCMLTAKPESAPTVRNNGSDGAACYSWMTRSKNLKEIWSLYQRAIALGRQSAKA